MCWGAGKGLENSYEQLLFGATKREAMEGEVLRVAGQQQNIEQRDCIRQGQKHTVVLRIKLMKRDRVSVQERLCLRWVTRSK